MAAARLGVSDVFRGENQQMRGGLAWADADDFQDVLPRGEEVVS